MFRFAIAFWLIELICCGLATGQSEISYTFFGMGQLSITCFGLLLFVRLRQLRRRLDHGRFARNDRP